MIRENWGTVRPHILKNVEEASCYISVRTHGALKQSWIGRFVYRRAPQLVERLDLLGLYKRCSHTWPVSFGSFSTLRILY